MTPETIGLSRNPEDAGIVMGKHSGRNALSTRLTQLGFDLSPQEVDDVFKRFKVREVLCEVLCEVL
jgi:2-isopropylmalate synthase